MQFRELKQLVESTSDAAFAVDGLGLIVVWNEAAEAMFGLPAKEVVGQPCDQIVRGTDEAGEVCSPECSVQQAVRCHHQVGNFDLQVPTQKGTRWCNVSVLVADVTNSTQPYSLHIIRAVDMPKKLELLVRDFIVSETQLPPEQLKALYSTTRSPARGAELSKRELEVLRLLAKGATTKSIAGQLHISRTTVNNHTQHILHKLNAHSRLEAIRRAELAGLI